MEKPKKESGVKDYTTVEGQLKMLRALLLAAIGLLIIIVIRYHSQYSELEEKYRLLDESNQLLFESNRLLFGSDQLLHEQYQEILHMNHEITDLLQELPGAFEIMQPVP
ncbi:MAG: hypothetical protein HFH84_18820 [Lachnospiraceae bacterium]|nr:hypothetical protein [Lachnospiraceae bacterium]